jgi:hypothetical protein
VNGLLDDPNYQFFKNISLSMPANNLYSMGTLFKFETDQDLYLLFVESRGVNDNVYGTVAADVNYAGWISKLHKFNDLLGSDKIEVQLFNTSNVKVFDVTFDMLFKQTVNSVVSYNSGLTKFAPAGASIGNYDGSNSSALGYTSALDAQTSIDQNQGCGWALYTTKSPFPEGSVPCWEYRIMYEIKISKTSLGLSGTTSPN